MAILNIKSYVECKDDCKIVTYKFLGIPVLRHTKQYAFPEMDRSSTSVHRYF